MPLHVSAETARIPTGTEPKTTHPWPSCLDISSTACSRSSLRESRMFTIEVDPQNRTIVAAKGERDSRPSPATREIMPRWAGQEGPKLAEWV